MTIFRVFVKQKYEYMYLSLLLEDTFIKQLLHNTFTGSE